VVSAEQCHRPLLAAQQTRTLAAAAHAKSPVSARGICLSRERARATLLCQAVDSAPRLPLDSRPVPAERPGAKLLALPLCPIDDDELVSGLCEQQPAAVAELLSRYTDLVRCFLVRTLGSAADLDDLTQETFLTVIRRVGTLREPTALRSFVVSVAIRVARNELRKRSIRRFVGLEAEGDLPVALPHDAAAAQGVRHLYAALDRMNANHRLAFVLRHVEGYDLLEAAGICGCSLATLKRWLARAEQRFGAIARADPVLRELLDTPRRDR